MISVQLRFFAGAAEAAGVSSLRLELPEPTTVADVLAAGARRVTVSTAVFGAADPLAVTRSLADAVAAAWEADGGSAAYRLDAFA